MKRITFEQAVDAAVILSDYCRRHDSCNVCSLADDEGNCALIVDVPDHWNSARLRPKGTDPDENV